MKRQLAIAVLMVAIGGVFAATAERHDQPLPAAGSQPDTTASNWRFISGDVGLQLRHDDRLGMRGRLYVRVDNVWQPLAMDGTAELSRIVPIK
jgi:hypothetical protein